MDKFHNDVPMDDDKKAAFDRLYLEYYPKLFHYVGGVLDYRNLMLVEDIVHDTFMTAWKKMDELCCHPNPGGWLMNTAKNKLRARRNKASSKEMGLDDYSIEPIEKESGYEAAELEMVVEKVLTPHDRGLFYKYFVEGYSVKEMAAQEKMTEGAFKVKMSRIRKKIQKECGWAGMAILLFFMNLK